jgi:DNA-binding transcriptional MerR regulator
MLKISEFARLTQLPVKTIRFYDEIGLLKPAHVDEWTGYRYYSAEQLPRLYRILALKALGFSLEQIRDLLTQPVSAEQLRGMLILKRADIQRRLEEEHERLQYVEAKLRLIETEDIMGAYDVVMKAIPAVRVASVRDESPTFADLGRTFERLFNEVGGYLARHGAQANANPGERALAVYHQAEHEPLVVEAALGVMGALPANDRVKVYDLPALPHAVSVIHRGPYSTIEAAYGAVMKWIEVNRYALAGPVREVYLAFDRDGDPAAYVTEVVLPVTAE